MPEGQAGRGTGELRDAHPPPRAEGALFRRRARILYATAAGLYVADRVSKVLAERLLQGGPPIDIIPGVFRLRYTTNPGGAFGLFGGLTWLFVAASVVVVVAVVWSSRRLPASSSAIALGLVLGGALGNLTDRVVRGPGFSGEVVDLFDLQVWPVFNVADVGIVVGAAILILAGLARDRRGAERRA